MLGRILTYVGLAIAFVAGWTYGIDHAPILAVWTCYIAYVLIVVAFSQPKGWNATRLVRNGAVAVAISVVVVWLVSVVVFVRVPYAPKRAVAIGSGSFYHLRGVSMGGTPLTLSVIWLPTSDVFGGYGTWQANWSKSKVAYSKSTPIWPLALALVIPAAVLCPLVPKRHPEGHCQRCGYDLTGNVSGTCPECGSSPMTGKALKNDNA